MSKAEGTVLQLATLEVVVFHFICILPRMSPRIVLPAPPSLSPVEECRSDAFNMDAKGRAGR